MNCIKTGDEYKTQCYKIKNIMNNFKNSLTLNQVLILNIKNDECEFILAKDIDEFNLIKKNKDVSHYIAFDDYAKDIFNLMDEFITKYNHKLVNNKIKIYNDSQSDFVFSLIDTNCGIYQYQIGFPNDNNNKNSNGNYTIRNKINVGDLIKFNLNLMEFYKKHKYI
jgi:hypothetical protein